MRRRRVRIRVQRHEEEQKLPPARSAAIQSAEAVPVLSVTPAQARILEIQQQRGNQSVLRTLIQRAAANNQDQEDEQAQDGTDAEKQNALSEVVDTGDQVTGINDKSSNPSLHSAAVTAYKAKKYGIALIAFRELFRDQPTPGLMVNMAICEIRLDLFPEAIHNLQQALDGSDGLSMLDRKRALLALDAAKKLESANSVGFLPLPGNIDTDAATVSKEPRALRNELRSIFQSAEGAAKGETYEFSLTAFRLAQRRLPNPITLINIGKCLVMLQRYSEAATAFDQALRDKQLPSSLRKMAEAELELVKHFQGQALDALGGLPAPTP